MVYPEKKPVNKKKMRSLVIVGVVVLVLLILIATFSPFVTVPTGHTGVVVAMGRVADNVLAEGLNFKLPWQNVIMIDNRAQKASLELQAFSSDIQQVDVACSINYSVDRETSQNLYKNVGVTYYSTVMMPRILENVKAVFSKYTAENLIVTRELLSDQIESLLSPELKAYGIELLSVAIENVDFTDAFTDAVENKQVAEQTKLKTQIQQSEMLMVEQTTAERAIIAANAEAEVAKIDADAKAYAREVEAQAEAEANAKIAASITPELIDYMQINRWDGALPKIMSGDEGFMPLVNMEIE